MFERIHQKLGTAGFIISIIALVAALGGAAYAASGGLSGKQKKEVEKIAKKVVGKPGATGATGPAGAPGTKGDAGAAGSNGSPGAAGTSVASKAIPTSSTTCSHHGGSEFTSASGTTTACNGEPGEEGPEGSPWTAGGTLPSGATETGTFFVGAPVPTIFEHGAIEEISFPLPLAEPIEASETEPPVRYVAGSPVIPPELATVPPECENAEHPGSASSSNPEAQPGYLCLFEVNHEAMNFEAATLFDGVNEIGRSGTLLIYNLSGTGQHYAAGTWAVTAP
jgi:hypothetical protein